MDERRRGGGGGDSKELKTPRQDVKAEIESQRNQIRELVDSVKKISLECDEKTRTLKLIRSKFSSSAAKSIKFGEKGKKEESTNNRSNGKFNTEPVLVIKEKKLRRV